MTKRIYIDPPLSTGESDRRAAVAVARQLAGGDATATLALVETAELAVLRRLASLTLPGGEAEYWRLVREEIES